MPYTCFTSRHEQKQDFIFESGPFGEKFGIEPWQISRPAKWFGLVTQVGSPLECERPYNRSAPPCYNLILTSPSHFRIRSGSELPAAYLRSRSSERAPRAWSRDSQQSQAQAPFGIEETLRERHIVHRLLFRERNGTQTEVERHQATAETIRQILHQTGLEPPSQRPVDTIYRYPQNLDVSALPAANGSGEISLRDAYPALAIPSYAAQPPTTQQGGRYQLNGVHRGQALIQQHPEQSSPRFAPDANGQRTRQPRNGPRGEQRDASPRERGGGC